MPKCGTHLPMFVICATHEQEEIEMNILIGITVVSAFAALLWLTRHHTMIHIAVLCALIPAAFLFGAVYGLSAGLLIAIGGLMADILVIRKMIEYSRVPVSQ